MLYDIPLLGVPNDRVGAGMDLFPGVDFLRQRQGGWIGVQDWVVGALHPVSQFGSQLLENAGMGRVGDQIDAFLRIEGEIVEFLGGDAVVCQAVVEEELFAGTVVEVGKNHGMRCGEVANVVPLVCPNRAFGFEGGVEGDLGKDGIADAGVAVLDQGHEGMTLKPCGFFKTQEITKCRVEIEVGNQGVAALSLLEGAGGTKNEKHPGAMAGEVAFMKREGNAVVGGGQYEGVVSQSGLVEFGEDASVVGVEPFDRMDIIQPVAAGFGGVGQQRGWSDAIGIDVTVVGGMFRLVEAVADPFGAMGFQVANIQEEGLSGTGVALAEKIEGVFGDGATVPAVHGGDAGVTARFVIAHMAHAGEDGFIAMTGKEVGEMTFRVEQLSAAVAEGDHAGLMGVFAGQQGGPAG